MMLSMNYDQRRNHIQMHASQDYLWEPAVISVDGVTVHDVYALDTVRGWVMAYDEDAFGSMFALKTITGVVEYVRLDASDQ